MNFQRIDRFVLSWAAAGCLAAPLWAAEPSRPTRTDREQLPKPVYRVAQDLATATPVRPETTKTHPIEPAIALALEAKQQVASVQDYTCSMMKQERIDGKLLDPEIMFVKVRHEPFSVYTYFLSPSSKKGQEAIFIQGRNNGNLLGHGVGLQKAIGMVKLDPKGYLAMRDNRYPITEMGISNLIGRLLEMAEKEKRHDDVQVEIKKGAKIDGRPCLCIQVVHPVHREGMPFHKAEVFVDEQLKLPVRYAAYEFPRPGDKRPPLLESYTYYNLKLNAELGESDFDHNNSAYGFH